ncbi:hypothetical protein KXW14_008877 [Aspergillus fumigatus]|nr:hypothetical protein KXV90_008386 [Aspergillus fumigatus]KMK57455.1 polyketide synthase [Aspergillus fumigatus Z5]KAH2240477.1 hypothetical protein KXW14_008877 [Aspergillus fumigatus]KAH2978784.1 hypothetical protein KXV25_004172 [Aspergillus fumigatus]KAH2981415.1 hypothetical protein KXW58_001947 [Aspergillus fumigatus]
MSAIGRYLITLCSRRLNDPGDAVASGKLPACSPEAHFMERTIPMYVGRNNRLHSGRHPILVNQDPEEAWALGYDDNSNNESFFGFHGERFVPLAVEETFVTVQAETEYSLAKALGIGQLGYFYLIQDRVAGIDGTVVALSETCVQVPFHRLVTITNQADLNKSIRNATQCLVDAVTVANKVSNDHNGSVLKGNEIVSLKRGPKINAVVDWKSGQIIPSRIRSMEIDQTFVDNKKYLIIGLAGDLGRSIARFMVERGSPYDITLEMSHNPNKNPLITVKLQKERYGPKDAEAVTDAHLLIVSIFSRNPVLRVEDEMLDQGPNRGLDVPTVQGIYFFS